MSNNNYKKLSLIYSGSSDIGVIRHENQDSFAKLPENNSDLFNGKGQLFIVADGVGGHTGGKQASQMAVEIIGGHFNAADVIDKTLLKKAFETANAQIYDKANNSIEFNRMATTCSALLLKENIGIIAHVGDSRVYRIYNNKIEQLTKDHTQVQELLRQGVIKKEEVENYPNKSVLIRAMGAEPKIAVDLFDISLTEEQYFVLCSDGLAKVKEDEILNIVTHNSPEVSCKMFISLANERGGKDNVTVQVVKLFSNNNTYVKKNKSKSAFYFTLIALLLIAAAAVLIKFGNPFRAETNIPVNQDIQKVTTDTVPPVKNIEENPEITRADKLFASGKIENALTIYKSILEAEPMDLRAIKGLNNIAEYYFRRAERLRKANDINGAVKLYYKVNEIQPDHEMSNYYIRLYRNRAK